MIILYEDGNHFSLLKITQLNKNGSNYEENMNSNHKEKEKLFVSKDCKENKKKKF